MEQRFKSQVSLTQGDDSDLLFVDDVANKILEGEAFGITDIATLTKFDLSVRSPVSCTAWLVTREPSSAFQHYPPSVHDSCACCMPGFPVRASHIGSGYWEINLHSAQCHYRLSRRSEHLEDSQLYLVIAFAQHSDTPALVSYTVSATPDWQVIQQGKTLTNGGLCSLGRSLRFSGSKASLGRSGKPKLGGTKKKGGKKTSLAKRLLSKRNSKNKKKSKGAKKGKKSKKASKKASGKLRSSGKAKAKKSARKVDAARMNALLSIIRPSQPAA